MHEAGHLVVAEKLGFDAGRAIVGDNVAYCTVGMGDGAPPPLEINSSSGSRPGSLSDLLVASYPWLWPGKTFQEAGLAYSTMLMAGRQAELIEAGVVLNNTQRLSMRDSDHLSAEAILNRVGLNYLALGHCQHESRVLLKRHWDEVVEVAKRLERFK